MISSNTSFTYGMIILRIILLDNPCSRICSSKSEKVFLHGDVRLLFSTVYDDSKDDSKTKIEYPNPKVIITV